MKERPFKVIKGGLDAPYEKREKTFCTAFATDTRLMGVVGLYIHWEIGQGSEPYDFHQFFYFDAEEYGLETYQSIVGNDVLEIALVEQALIGGLGGRKVDLTEEEAVFLVQEFANTNERLRQPLPEKEQEYGFLLAMETDLTRKERNAIIAKICTKILSDYHAVNYFLMRCFGKDYPAASWLCEGSFPLNVYADLPSATLCKKTIDLFEQDGKKSYLCESLIEYKDRYHVVISELTVANLKVTSFEKRSVFRISAPEAAMMLSRPEFVTVYDILIGPDEFNRYLGELTQNTMLTVHENGRLFLVFNKDNDHVNKRVFRLSEDVFGLYYVTDFGQLILAAYNISGIHTLEKEVRLSALDRYLAPVSKFEFKEPVLYEFVQSDFDDFNDFIDYIKDE